MRGIIRAAYTRAIEAAGGEQATADTCHCHAMFFVRWLRGNFEVLRPVP